MAQRLDQAGQDESGQDVRRDGEERIQQRVTDGRDENAIQHGERRLVVRPQGVHPLAAAAQVELLKRDDERPHDRHEREHDEGGHAGQHEEVRPAVPAKEAAHI